MRKSPRPSPVSALGRAARPYTLTLTPVHAYQNTEVCLLKKNNPVFGSVASESSKILFRLMYLGPVKGGALMAPSANSQWPGLRGVRQKERVLLAALHARYQVGFLCAILLQHRRTGFS